MWNSLSFGNIQKKKKKISTLSSLVNRALQSTHLSHPIQKELVLQKALDDLYLQGEILWKSKSQATWLTCKDLNTKFFHLSTLIKRRQNAIDFLKLSSGNWTSDRTTIGTTMSDHFTSLFSTSRPVISDDLLGLFDCQITPEENISLCTIPSEKEIFNALTSIGATKAPGLDDFTALF